jgi:hypothetical protein
VKIIERVPELAILEDRLRACGRGHGGMVWIAGAPIIGKTILLREFSQLAEASGACVLTTACARFERHRVFGLLRRLFSSPEIPEYLAERAVKLLDNAEPFICSVRYILTTSRVILAAYFMS